MKNNLWSDTIKASDLPVLNEERETDVAILGAGITGLTAAYQLTQAGKNVIVIEADTIGGSTSSNSSAHLTTSNDYYYSKIVSRQGKDTARAVAGSRQAAVSFIAGMADSFPCDLKYVSGFLYSESDGNIIGDEYRHASEAGLKVSLTNRLPLPFPVKSALEFSDQAIFNPSKYLVSLADYLNNSKLCEIYENSRVISREENKVATMEGSVRAKEILYATHYPVFIDTHQTMAYPYRSYMIAAHVEEDIGDSLFWDTADPYHYTRTYGYAGKKYLLLGGADHKTGHTNKNSYLHLENYLHERYTVRSIPYKWSSQYYEPADGLPYIGKSYSGSEYIATGYSGDGLVYGTIAGIIISSLILGVRSKLRGDIYDASRIDLPGSAGKFISENIAVASDMVKDRLKSKSTGEEENPDKGDGILIKSKGKTLALSRDNNGRLSQVSAVCPHMKCLVRWNRPDQSWDCPCHGSRFTPAGKVISGPAVVGLQDVPSDREVMK
jgi:glycine/D-amino acid oxidase-like deaminating enzyme/nitrite reductase/ring-hydroxylating ferredoxin subunit